MKRMLGLATIMMVAAGVSGAQVGIGPGGARYFVYKSDASADEVARLFSEFVHQGITLTPDQQARGLEIIKRTRAELMALQGRGAEGDSARSATRCAQHSELRALLTTDADKRQFDENFPSLPSTCRNRGSPG